MRVRLILSSIVLAALAANPGFAKDGHSRGHAQHGASASAPNNEASGKGTNGASPAPSKANAPIDSEAAVAPPVLPPHGVTKQQIRINPSVKSTNPGISLRRQVGVTPITAPTARNAIGQPVVSPAPKDFPGAQPPLPALQRSGAVLPPIIHGGPTAPPVSSGPGRVNIANNRGSVNGATVIRPANAPPGLGGPAQARYGINGTTVHKRH
jgi:hypothetical protein